MAKLKLRKLDEDEYLYPKTYTAEQHVMFGAYKAFVVYSCRKTFEVRKGMMDDIERISNAMNSDDFFNYLVARKGKYATLAQIIKDVCK